MTTKRNRPARESAPVRRFTQRGLKTVCRELRARLVGEDVATEEEVAAAMPGGARNPNVGLDGWIEAYAQLKSFARRLETRADRSDDEALEREVRRAASREPVALDLSIGEYAVHQKSAWALWFLNSLDDIVRPLAELTLEIAETMPDLRGMPALAQGLAWRTWAWILLHPAVGLPFDDAGVLDLPEWTAQLTEADFVAIYRAHKSLHHDSIVVMGRAFPEEQGVKSRLSLTGFLAGYAGDNGIQPSEIFRRWGMPEGIAAAVSVAEAHRVAKANAKVREPRT